MPSAAGPHGPARPEMLADYDAAALLGLAPQGGSSSGSGSGSSSISSWDGKGSGWGSETTAAVEVPLSRQPLWFDKWAEAHMRALLVSKSGAFYGGCKVGCAMLPADQGSVWLSIYQRVARASSMCPAPINACRQHHTSCGGRHGAEGGLL